MIILLNYLESKESVRISKILPLKTKDCISGAINDELFYKNEVPEHKVNITKGFYMGVYEITVGQFKKFISDSKRDDILSARQFIRRNSHGHKSAVTMVSWDDAQDFIKWLNKKENTNKYRLPTEAEWEYTIRAGTNTRYYWGNDTNKAISYAWYKNNASNIQGSRFAHTVGLKKPNSWGLYDMSGNVSEWVLDWDDERGGKYYKTSPLNDPKGIKNGRLRVLRGGDWLNHAGHLRSAFRDSSTPNSKYPNYGFRIIKTL